MKNKDILKLLNKAGGNKTHLALELMVCRKTLYNWLDGTHEVRGALVKKHIQKLMKKYEVK